MIFKESLEDRIRKLEKLVSDIESQLAKALCDHPQEAIMYTPDFYSDSNANPDYKKSCLQCSRSLGVVLESEMHNEIAESHMDKARVHKDAAQYIKSKSQE